MKFSYYVNSEYNRLKAVMLCRPHPAIEGLASPKEVLHARKIVHASLIKEYERILRLYKKLGIKIYWIDSLKIKGTDDSYVFNLMYTRDLFFMSPCGAIISRMAYGIRHDEVYYAQRTLKKIGIPIRRFIRGNAVFEGADALWVTPELVMVGVGNRTNGEGFCQLKEELASGRIRCVCVPAPQETLHLLGAVQLVDVDVALVRVDLVSLEIIKILRQNKIRIVRIPENAEIRKKHAMNFVTIAPRTIVMSAECPKTKKIYECQGIKVIAEVPTRQLVSGGGGLACATGILLREHNM